MATDGPGSLSGPGFRAQSLPPPRPKSPPDLYGRRREMVRLQVIEREKSFLEEELKFAHRLQPASRCCKEIVEFVAANADPLLPTNRKSSKPCRLWKWLCGSSCFSLSWLCCCTGCSDCTLNLKPPQCCSCESCALNDCCSCIRCSLPKCSCCSNPCSCIWPENPCRGNCKTCGSCCSFKSLPCFDCCSCKCNCSCPKCPTCSELCICDCNCNCSCPKCPSCSDLCNCNCKCRTCSDLCHCKCSCPKVPSCSDICNSCLGCVGCITNCCCCKHCCICC